MSGKYKAALISESQMIECLSECLSLKCKNRYRPKQEGNADEHTDL